jgi:hypothetical protein
MDLMMYECINKIIHYIFMYQFINKFMYYIINLCINDLIYTLQCNNVLLNTLRSIYSIVLSLYYFISILILY